MTNDANLDQVSWLNALPTELQVTHWRAGPWTKFTAYYNIYLFELI